MYFLHLYTILLLLFNEILIKINIVISIFILRKKQTQKKINTNKGNEFIHK